MKSKCLARQEFVIGGFTEPEGARQGSARSWSACYDGDGALRFAGKVGPASRSASARSCAAASTRSSGRPRPSPTRRASRGAGDAHWVEPKLVAEVTFTEWTTTASLRQPSFQGLRLDKPAREVVRERAAARTSSDPPAPARAATPAPPRRAVAARCRDRSGTRAPKDTAEVAGIRLTHPERVLYPDLGLTKLELARFYEAIAEWIVPHVAGRPLSSGALPDRARQLLLREARDHGGRRRAAPRSRSASATRPASTSSPMGSRA